jgi:diacylglycerol kinase family enzyme
VLIEAAPGPGFVAQLRLAAAKARILGVAGGDGTVSTASAVALDHGLPRLMIPAGTFNHFAADVGIRSAHDAVTALTSGEAVLVDVGISGNRPFVNTSSTGIYVDLVQAREQLEGALGKGPAALIGLIQVLRRATAPAYRPDLSDGCLDIRVIDAGRLARSRLIAAVATGTLGRSRVYHSWQARSADVASADGRPIWLSIDGEVATAETGFRQSKHQRGLLVYRRAAS